MENNVITEIAEEATNEVIEAVPMDTTTTVANKLVQTVGQFDMSRGVAMLIGVAGGFALAGIGAGGLYLLDKNVLHKNRIKAEKVNEDVAKEKKPNKIVSFFKKKKTDKNVTETPETEETSNEEE